MRPLKVLHVAREFAGFAEAGGIKDAVSGLAGALRRSGVLVSAALPLYGFLRERLNLGKPAVRFMLPIPDHDRGNRITREPVGIHCMDADGVRLLLVESPRYGDKRGVYTYAAEDEAENPHKKKGTGHWDSHQMNIILQKAALEAVRRLRDVPDVIHCHDGHAAFLPALIREQRAWARVFSATGAVVTIHNAGLGYHQEIWDIGFARLLTGLSAETLKKGMLGSTVDPLLLAGYYARISTVSEQYALELIAEKAEGESGGLGRAYRENGIPLTGITNGVDPEPFDPRRPQNSGIPFGFDPSTGDWEGKRRCKQELLSELSLGSGSVDRPLFGFIGRLARQKGIEVLRDAAHAVLAEGAEADFAVLGQGESRDEELLTALSRKTYPRGAMRFVSRYDPALSKRIYASADFLLIPSEYEPCGLTDFHAQLMGTIPVVHRVGGLVKVRDGETGISYREQSSAALAAAIRRCLELHGRDPGMLDRMRRRAFDEIFLKHTWDTVVREGYLPLYETARPQRARH